jgi:flagellar motor switch protein FliN/FliY
MAEQSPTDKPAETTPPAPDAASATPVPDPAAAAARSAEVAPVPPADTAAAPALVAAATAASAGVLDEAGAEALLKSAAASQTPAAQTPAAESPPDAATAAASPDATLDPAQIEEMLKQASFEDASSGPTASPAADAEPFNLPSFQQAMADAQVSSIDLLRDVELNVKIELGRNRMLVEDVLKLAEGSVVELDKLAGDPVDVFVNDRLVARGEVLVLNDNFCVRVNEIVVGAREEAL